MARNQNHKEVREISFLDLDTFFEGLNSIQTNYETGDIEMTDISDDNWNSMKAEVEAFETRFSQEYWGKKVTVVGQVRKFDSTSDLGETAVTPEVDLTFLAKQQILDLKNKFI